MICYAFHRALFLATDDNVSRSIVVPTEAQRPVRQTACALSHRDRRVGTRGDNSTTGLVGPTVSPVMLPAARLSLIPAVTLSGMGVLADQPANIPNLDVACLAEQRRACLCCDHVIWAVNPLKAIDDVEFIYGDKTIGGHCAGVDVCGHLRGEMSKDAALPGDLRHQRLGARDTHRFVIYANAPAETNYNLMNQKVSLIQIVCVLTRPRQQFWTESNNLIW